MRRKPVVAIDGPAGVGKSTAAQALADRLGYVRVDTGALYRAVALAAQEDAVDWNDGPALGELTAGLDLRFERSTDGTSRVLLGGKDRESQIRTPEIARGASDVSRHPEVRAALLGLQRRLGEAGGVVVEGRDIGTVVFPQAEVKVFLTASAEERARRRLGDLQQRGIEADFEETLRALEERDRQDSGRAVAPLKPAHDAIVVDATELSFEQVVERLATIVAERDETPELG